MNQRLSTQAISEPTPADPNPSPTRPGTPSEAPQRDVPIGVPSSVPEQIPVPSEPVGVPPTSPPEIPSNPTTPQPTM